jgi:hypothetical protein
MAVTVENVTPGKTRIDCRTDLKAFWTTRVQRRVLDAQAAAKYDSGEVLDTETKSKIIGEFLLKSTNYPLPERITADRYQVLSRDGVTRHDLTRSDCFSDWQCSCDARGYCWHLGYMEVFEISGVFLEEHLPIDDLAPAPTRGDLLPPDPKGNRHADWGYPPADVWPEARSACVQISDDEFTCVDYGYPPAPVHPDDLALPVQSLRGKSVIFAPEEIAS